MTGDVFNRMRDYVLFLREEVVEWFGKDVEISNVKVE